MLMSLLCSKRWVLRLLSGPKLIARAAVYEEVGAGDEISTSSACRISDAGSDYLAESSQKGVKP
jgi:hypothetical protein